MENIEGVYYFEVKIRDSSTPKCSLCQVPVEFCQKQCEKYEDDVYLVKSDIQNLDYEDGCVTPLVYIALIILVLTITLTTI